MIHDTAELEAKIIVATHCGNRGYSGREAMVEIIKEDH